MPKKSKSFFNPKTLSSKFLLISLGLFFLTACQSYKRRAFLKSAQEELELIAEERCMRDLSCIEEQGGFHINNRLCDAGKSRDHGFNENKECLMTAYKLLSQRIEKEVRPVFFDCHPGEYCQLPEGCTYEAAIEASKIPGRGCL